MWARQGAPPRPTEAGKLGSLLRGSLPGVGFQNAAKGLRAFDLIRAPVGRRIVNLAIERQVVQRLVWPSPVVKSQVGCDEMPKVVFAEYNEVNETLDLERLQSAFHEGIHEAAG